MSIQGIMGRRGENALREDYKMVEVILSSPRGFCAGVVRAIDVVEECLERFGPPVYVKHQIVHNPYVVAELEQKGRHHGGGSRRGSRRFARGIFRPRVAAGGFREGSRT